MNCQSNQTGCSHPHLCGWEQPVCWPVCWRGHDVLLSSMVPTFPMMHLILPEPQANVWSQWNEPLTLCLHVVLLLLKRSLKVKLRQVEGGGAIHTHTHCYHGDFMITNICWYLMASSKDLWSVSCLFIDTNIINYLNWSIDHINLSSPLLPSPWEYCLNNSSLFIWSFCLFYLQLKLLFWLSKKYFY